MSTCLVGLGSNLGDRQQTLIDAIAQLARHPEIDDLLGSHFYETPAVGGPAGQEAYLNAVIRLETSLTPASLHEQLRRVENRQGRQRRDRWAARTLDLDLLLYDDQRIDTPQLTVPHPRMAMRSFVLAPAAEVAGQMIHPQIGWSLDKLWRHITSTPRYVAIAGPPGAGKTRLAREVAERLARQQQMEIQLVADTIPDEMLDKFHRDPGGQGWRAEIERFRLRQAALEAAARKADRGKESASWLISDFWLAQSLAYADVSLDAARRAELDQAWQAIGGNIIRPTLLVVLTADTNTLDIDTWVAAGERSGGASENFLTREAIESMQQSLAQWVVERHTGPRLELEMDPWQRAVDEVTAALLAMEVEPIRL